jgi:transcriptional regulator with XRE-family HTH domain
LSTVARQRRPGTKQGPPESKLEEWRMKRDLSQPQMSRYTGISMTSYQRLEEVDYESPPYTKLQNCAIVLGVSLDELIEDKFKGWTVFKASAKKPPEMPVWEQQELSD